MTMFTRTLVLLGACCVVLQACKHTVTGPSASTITVEVTASPSPATIPIIPLNASATATITLHNSSTVRSARFVGVSLSGSGVASFGIDSIGTLPLQIDSGGSIAFTVRYSPISLGNTLVIVTMHVTADTASATIVDTIYASAGVPATGTLCASTDSIGFGSVQPATPPQSNGFTKTIWIRNCDSVPVKLFFDPSGPNTLSVQVTNSVFKTVLPRIDKTLNRGDSMSITVSFVPAAVGVYAGVLTIASPTAPHPINISLTGICDANGWPRGAGPDTVEFGNIPTTALHDTAFYVRNPFDVAILMTGLSESSKMDIVIPAHDFDKNPQLILGHDSLRVAIQVRPPAPGRFYDPMLIQFREVATSTVVIAGTGY